ncbi:DUF3995 domain-containing protein [Bacillus sp. B-jedd]|uniref:DUF3995 domain-containing protein n=1 Tax=Bacillus sp. B-jedd TaxID=1476857 RepID=UPI0005156640|nr:DUF3995 domain-containing protein [Bacillus sp. B-jedd]CEG28765.1 hypothetical protein BN1002_03688 [Bacillus sp. B-jedd]
MGRTTSFKLNVWFIYLGMIWSILFAGMSFYWAMGGLWGVKSLGGAIYEMSLNPSPSFLAIVWLTGFIKLLGAGLLAMLLRKLENHLLNRILYYVIKIAGAFLVLYGALNFITIFLHALHILEFDLDRYATFWRLVFWEPFWLAGGIFYFFAAKKPS